jgi:hypothetical protein
VAATAVVGPHDATIVALDPGPVRPPLLSGVRSLLRSGPRDAATAASDPGPVRPPPLPLGVGLAGEDLLKEGSMRRVP